MKHKFNHKIKLILILICQYCSSYSQITLNGLSFDGVDDEVVVPSASSLISGGSGISMAFWVYPKNSPIGFPDFDGMAGFRNNSDADFYVLQLSAGTIEARFRPSSGNNTDITFSGLTLFQWQHIAFTYSGTEIKFYHNGILTSTVPAAGSISNPSVDLLLGNLYYQGTAFQYQGKMDEFLLLDRALTQAEISCISAGHIDTAMSGLKLYYDMNVGIPSGLNTGLDSLSGLPGQSTGSLNNFALSDSISNWVSGIVNIEFLQGDVCPGNLYNFNGMSYSPGSHFISLTDSSSCVARYYLTVNEVSANIDTSLIVTGNTLSVASGAGTYQWLNCANNFAAIPGASNAQFNAGTAGSYACVIGSSGCYDTTRCVTIGSSFMEENESNIFLVHPVPADDFFIMTLIKPVQGLLQIFDTSGRCIERKEIKTNRERISTQGFSEGLYHIIFTDQSGKYLTHPLLISRFK